jgi:catechol 2,3-dioxygenase-like lactoylglutathione lyase family enzyme
VNHPVTGIDHVYLLTDDLDRAAAQWQRLGFTVTPRGLHSTHMGTGNHTMMLQEDYIELLGVLTPTEANAQQRAALEASGQGLHAIACRIADAEAAVAALDERGIAAGPVRHFARPVDLPGGKTGEAAFSVAVFDPAEVPQGSVFMCQHRTRPAVWVPEWMDHPNGATALGAVVAVSDDPEGTAASFARLFAAGAVTDLPNGKRVETGTAPVLVLTPEGVASRYPGMALDGAARGVFTALEVVADMAKAGAVLGDLARPVPHGLAVSPEHATGAMVVFSPTRQA